MSKASCSQLKRSTISRKEKMQNFMKRKSTMTIFADELA